MITKRGDTWYIDTTIKGQRVRESLHTDDKATAKARAKVLEQALWEGTAVRNVRVVTLADAFDEHYEVHWDGTKDAKGVLSRFRTLERFIPGTTDVTTINRDRVDQLVLAMKKATYERQEGGKQYPYSRSTINRVLALLGTLLNALEEKGLIDKAPKMPKTKEEGRQRFMTEAEESAMWAALEASDNPNHVRCLRLFKFLSATGCRMGEALNLQWSDVDLERGWLVLRDTKSGKSVGKGLITMAKEVLIEEYLDNVKAPFAGIGETMYRNAWEYAKAQAGLADDRTLVRHSIRHTTASRLVARGVPLANIQKFLGHENIQTTLKYAHLTDAGDRLVMEALDPVTGTCRKTEENRTYPEGHVNGTLSGQGLLIRRSLVRAQVEEPKSLGKSKGYDTEQVDTLPSTPICDRPVS